MADSYVVVPDLLYRGQQVYTLEAGTAPSPTPTTTPTPAPVPTTQSSYPIGLLTDADKRHLCQYLIDKYRTDLRLKPGSHQVMEDMLTLNGRNVWEWAGAATGESLQYKINVIKNQYSNGMDFADPDYIYGKKYLAYNGPLVQIYKNLVALKLTM